MDNIIRDATIFSDSMKHMVAKNNETGTSSYSNYLSRLHDYSEEEIADIIKSSSIESKIKLSRNYFAKDGIYRRIILYYATIINYDGILIPSPSFGKSLSTSYIQKKYYSALNYLDKLSLKDLFIRIATTCLVDGCYYGIIQSITKTKLTIIDLPPYYCRTRYKDWEGNDLLEFNVQYFNTLHDMDNKQKVINSYPSIIRKSYDKWSHGKLTSPWVFIPANLGICFPYLNDARPPFLEVIPATIHYDLAVQNDLEREAEEIKKIIVQHIPHLADGRLLFEPPEAEVLHSGTVGMLKGNKNLSVLTTYGEVEAIVSKTSGENVLSSSEKTLPEVYTRAGVTPQLFTPTSTQSLQTSIRNDIAFMSVLFNRFSTFLTNIINQLFSNSNLTFNYMFLPVGIYNQSEYISDSLKLAQSGYSFLLPSIAMGISQGALVSLKQLETEVLKLDQLLQPLSSSYTQSDGAPTKEAEDKTEKTIKSEDPQGEKQNG